MYFCVLGMASDKQFVNILWDVIRKRGKLVSDPTQLEVGKKVNEISFELITGKQSLIPAPKLCVAPLS